MATEPFVSEDLVIHSQEDDTRGISLSAVENKRRVCLVWEDLIVVSTSPRRNLLSGLSGYAELNRIMALIGPSGSGKTTLLDALAGKLPANVSMTGNVLINWTKRSTACKDISYVTQEDCFLGHLTVRETLTYAAHLRLPASMAKKEIDTMVTKILAEMGLQDGADNRISNGEKRRSISIEMGETVYFGETTMALKFFVDAGFPCPTRKIPLEHFLQCVSQEFDNVATLQRSKNVNEGPSSWNSLMHMTTWEIKSILIREYRNSIQSANAMQKVREIKLPEEPLIGKTYHTSRLKQLRTLTHRSFLNMTRDIGYYWLRMLFYILVSTRNDSRKLLVAYPFALRN